MNWISKVLVMGMITFFACVSAYPNDKIVKGYDLIKPNLCLTLPDSLHEISGLTAINSNCVACIQDEKGIVFIYDTEKMTIIKQYPFAKDGDYEGIARVGKTIYILRSDGKLFEISNYDSKSYKTASYLTGLPAADNEGLCYDAENNRLLIACKSKIGKKSLKDQRVIFGFNLQTKTLTQDPVLACDVQAIKHYATANQINLPTKSKKKGGKIEPDIKLRISAIGIHPLTKRIYMLSASDYLLVVFNAQGAIEHVQHLNPGLFNQAEGITFLENGDMLVANEGDNKKPTLLKFKYRN